MKVKMIADSMNSVSFLYALSMYRLIQLAKSLEIPTKRYKDDLIETIIESDKFIGHYEFEVGLKRIIPKIKLTPQQETLLVDIIEYDYIENITGEVETSQKRVITSLEKKNILKIINKPKGNNTKWTIKLTPLAFDYYEEYC